jgi:hypothetical protein
MRLENRQPITGCAIAAVNNQLSVRLNFLYYICSINKAQHMVGILQLAGKSKGKG